MLRQGLSQKLQQKLSPNQIQLMKMLEIPGMELEQRIKEEMEANPALEEGAEQDEDEIRDEENDNDEEIKDEEEQRFEDEKENEGPDEKPEDIDLSEYFEDDDVPYYKLQIKNTGPDDEVRETPVVFQGSFTDNLQNQLSMLNLSESEHIIADQILGSLDDDGYLRRPLKSVANDLAFSSNVEVSEEDVAKVLEVIQSLEPPGIGARDLQECLLLQLNRILVRDETQLDSVDIAIRIISETMTEFSKKLYIRIQEKLKITEDQLKSALEEILKLNPKPGNTFASSNRSQEHIIPDFLILNNDGELELQLTSQTHADLRVSRDYIDMLRDYSKGKDKTSKEAVTFVRQKLDKAKWFIDALKQRQITLYNTMYEIMLYQKEYFLTGDATKIRPMILKDIAEKTFQDLSTVSRVSNSKYVQTPFGTLSLKSFFSDKMQTDSGEEVSTREVKQGVIELIENEDKKKPYTDEQLVTILKERGYQLARRTVAKYREMLDIPPARLRREL